MSDTRKELEGNPTGRRDEAGILSLKSSHCTETQHWWVLDSAQKMLIHFLWQMYWFYKVSIVTPDSQGCVQQMIHIKYKKNFQKESPVSGITEMKFHIKLQD